MCLITNYHTKLVDAENKEGLFRNYKSLVEKVSRVILTIKPDFQYPRALASNLFEMANNHIYFGKHLPRLTDVSVDEEDSEVERIKIFDLNLWHGMITSLFVCSDFYLVRFYHSNLYYQI